MKLFTHIATELTAYEKRRESVIRSSRDILRDAKSIIFLSHEGKLDEATAKLEQVSKRVKQLETDFVKPLRKGMPKFPLYQEGSWCAAAEEYLEAWFFVQFLSGKAMKEPAGISPKPEVFIGALADFTGEVLRAAVLTGARKDVKSLRRYRRVIIDVVGFLLPLYLTGQSRMKLDQAKKNLKRIEEIIYEVEIRT